MAESFDPKSSSTPKIGDLLVSLADLPPTKVERFSVALGVPKRVVEESRVNHPSDICQVKSDSLSWWIANAEDLTWEAIAKALESSGVEERNLAKMIRTEHGIDYGMILNCVIGIVPASVCIYVPWERFGAVVKVLGYQS